MSKAQPPTYYDVLGVPVGASIDHIKDSYRLLAKKSPITDLAYQTLTDPKKRQKYDGCLMDRTDPQTRPQTEAAQGERDWGLRGRERCSCGMFLKVDDEWLCEDCWGRLEYLVVFDLFGGRIIHETELEIVSETDEEADSPYATCFGPFTKEEAEVFLKERNETRNKM
jgi:curved DNA-binding protein CbpA